MRAGKLDRTITIKRPGALVDDGFGNLMPGSPQGGQAICAGDTFIEIPGYLAPQTTGVIATCRAQVIQASTEEFMRSWGASTETAVVFHTRHVDGVSPADTVTMDGETFDIIEVKPIGRRRGLELRCKRTGP